MDLQKDAEYTMKRKSEQRGGFQGKSNLALESER